MEAVFLNMMGTVYGDLLEKRLQENVGQKDWKC